MSDEDRLDGLSQTRDLLIHYIELYRTLRQYHQREKAEHKLAKIEEEIDRITKLQDNT